MPSIFKRMPAKNSSAYRQAAEDLKNAMKGAGTNEEKLIKVTASFNAEEREEIAKTYIGTYGESLLSDLKKELTGDLEDLMRQLYGGRYEQWAKYINGAIKGSGTDEKQLVMLVLLMSDEDQREVEQAYKKIYNKDLLRAIEGDIESQQWAKLCRAWLNAKNENGAPAEQIADGLRKAAAGNGTDERSFIEILCNCHPGVYKQVNDIYEKKYGTTLAKTIKKEFAGVNENAFLTAHYTLLDHDMSVARYVDLSVKGAGTKQDILIQMTVLFSDRINGREFIDAYKPFGDPKKELKRDLTGKMEKAIMALWKL